MPNGHFSNPCDIERAEEWTPAGDHRRVLDGIFWIARTGAPWRDLPHEFGNWNSVYRQFLRWSRSGLWDVLVEALIGKGAVPDTLQMIDSTVIRAHHHAAGGRGDSSKCSRPFARWLLDQAPSPHQRRRSADRNRDRRR
ncbi:transposase [Rhodovulum sp. PH10]|uniref:transposase n=1 Tax=Rhodovulum sp. PH10 TaxID=1187851 RepID=UPI00031EC2D6